MGTDKTIQKELSDWNQNTTEEHQYLMGCHRKENSAQESEMHHQTAMWEWYQELKYFQGQQLKYYKKGKTGKMRQ